MSSSLPQTTGQGDKEDIEIGLMNINVESDDYVDGEKRFLDTALGEEDLDTVICSGIGRENVEDTIADLLEEGAEQSLRSDNPDLQEVREDLYLDGRGKECNVIFSLVADVFIFKHDGTCHVWYLR